MAEIDRISEQHAAATRRVLIEVEDINDAAKAARRRMGEQAYAERMAWEREQEAQAAQRQETPAERAVREQREEHQRLLQAAAQREAAHRANPRDTMPTVDPIDWDDSDGHLPQSWLV